MSEHNIVVQGGTTTRLLTAGKYCDRDILVTAEGGGMSIDVVTASAMPSAVVDGQIVVITDTTPGTVYIDTDEPASPVSGDLWIELAAGGDAALVLTDESPYLRNGLAAANQWSGSAWQTYDGHVGVDGAWVQFSSNLPAIGTALNDLTWEEIAAIAAAGQATKYFALGDAKQITMTGTVGKIKLSNYTALAFIIGFDHNADIEGSNTIHFMLHKSANTVGKNLAFVDEGYLQQPGATGYFNINGTNTNSNGWASSAMRKNILGSSTAPTSPKSNSMVAALPSDLRAVMKAVTKYTDNTGSTSNTEGKVTASTDYLWLLSEHEVFGARTYANSFEMNYQKQYEYFASGNSKVFYSHDYESYADYWWLRSPNVNGSTGFCCVGNSGNADTRNAGYSLGCSPCFCV